LLERKALPKLSEPVRYSAPLDADVPMLVQSVKVHGFEGLVAKRCDSIYEPGLRSGAWMKMRVNRGQEFVIGGYTRGTKTFDGLVFGYSKDGKLIYAARTRNGFTPVARAQLFKKFKGGGAGLGRDDENGDGGGHEVFTQDVAQCVAIQQRQDEFSDDECGSRVSAFARCLARRTPRRRRVRCQ
jgi:ATP-dependent DNA ligase